MERTNVAGEYWLGGNFTSALTGLGGLMAFYKPNLIKVDSNLVQNGVSTRNSFGMTYVRCFVIPSMFLAFSIVNVVAHCLKTSLVKGIFVFVVLGLEAISNNLFS